MDWSRANTKTDAGGSPFALMVFLQAICYNSQHYRGKKITASKHGEGLPICPTICVGRGTTLPEPLMNYSPLLVVDQSINSQNGNPLCHMQLTAKNVQLRKEMATLDLHGKSVCRDSVWDRNLLTLMKENHSVIRLPHRLKLATKLDRKA